MTVPPTTNFPPQYPPADPMKGIAPTQPNWIQDAEAIAKADIKRLEGKFARVCNTAMGLMVISIVAFLMAALALFRSCR